MEFLVLKTEEVVVMNDCICNKFTICKEKYTSTTTPES